MLKRTGAALLIVALILSSFTFVYAEDDNYKYFSAEDIAEYNRQSGFFETINAFPNASSRDISSTVTRIEFARMLTVLMNAESAASTDVNVAADLSGEEAKYGAYAVKLGWMNCENNSFYPYEPVTYSDAIYALVNVLGYKMLADENGGNFSAYEMTANRIGILGQESSYGDYPIPVGILFRLVNNSLDIEFFGRKVGTDEYAVMTGRTIMSECLNTEKHSGILYGTPTAHILRTDGVGDGNVEIDGVIYTASGDYDEYLGMAVDYYIDKSDHAAVKLIYMTERTVNKKLRINADDIDSGNNAKYVYYDGDKRKTVNLSAECLVLYNGSALLLPENTDWIPANGYVEFIDNNKDSKYDVVKIISYSHYVAGATEAEEKKIYDKYTPSHSLDLSEFEHIKIYSETGIEVGFEEIKTDDVLTVIKNKDDSNIKIYISRKTVDGAITGMGGKNGKPVYTIGGNEYTPAADYFGGDNAKLMEQGLFRMDINGQLVSFENGKDELRLGYLVKAIIVSDVFHSELGFKIFSQDGDMIIASAAERIKIDDSVYKDMQKAYSALLKGYEEPKAQVIQYKMTEGKITEIITAYNNHKSHEGLDPTSIMPDGTQSRDSLRVLRSKASYFSSVLKTVGNVGVGSDTVIFAVPDSVEGASDDDFGILKSVDTQKNYTCELYSKSDTDIVADAMVAFGSAGEAGDVGIGVVSDIVRTLDQDGTIYTQITLVGYPGITTTVRAFNGEENDVPGKNDSNTYELEIGDTVEYVASGVTNKLSNLSMLCKASDKGMERAKFTNPNGGLTGVHYRYSYGAVNEKSGSFFQLAFCNPEDYNGTVPADKTELYTTGGMYFVEVDTTGRETTVSKPTNTMTGKDYKDYLNDCEYAFVYLDWGYTRLTVIYK